MGLVQELATPDRLVAVVNALIAPARLRSLAEEHRVNVPGFRPGQAPLNLTARALAKLAFDQPALRKTLEGDIRRIGARRRDLVRDLDPADTGMAIASLSRVPAPEARGRLAALLSDDRAEIRAAGADALDRIAAGSLVFRSLPSERAPAGGESPRRRRTLALPGADRGRPESGAAARPDPRSDRRPDRRTPPRDGGGRRPAPRRKDEETERQLAALRKETTRQDRTIRRLREQLNELKSKANEAAPTEAPPVVPDPTSADDLRLARASLERSLRDVAAIFGGVNELSAQVEAGAFDDVEVGTRPTAPTRTSTLSPESKVHLPGPGPLWPKELDAFVLRLARSEAVESVHVLGATGGTLTRIVGFVSDSHVLAHVSDGQTVARLLIGTTASSPNGRAWIRHHFAEFGFDLPG